MEQNDLSEPEPNVWQVLLLIFLQIVCNDIDHKIVFILVNFTLSKFFVNIAKQFNTRLILPQRIVNLPYSHLQSIHLFNRLKKYRIQKCHASTEHWDVQQIFVFEVLHQIAHGHFSIPYTPVNFKPIPHCPGFII